MAISKLPEPDQSLKELVRYQDGFLYWTGHSDNRFKKNISKPIGSGVDRDSKQYLRMRVGKIKYTVHRIIYWIHTNEWPDNVDHIDGDIFNNHIENLRAATNSENQFNRGFTAKRVSRSTKPDVFRAFINIGPKCYHIGTYQDELTALYAGFLVRDLIAPGFPKIPEKLKGIINEESRRIQ